MPLGYKYAERNAPTEVDWYKVGKDMSDMLAETNRVREEKKDALDKAQRETLLQLANTPNGQGVTERQKAIEYANTASNSMKIQFDLMKRGQLSPKDWMIFRQNVSDGTDLYYNAGKVYQENYASIIENNQNKVESGLALDNAKEAEQFGGKNTTIQISPNGTLIAAMNEKQKIDGKEVWVPSNKPGKALSVNSINQLLINRPLYPTTSTDIKTWVANLGTEKKVIIENAELFKQGRVITESDITKRTDLSADGKSELFKFVQAENDTIDTFLGTEENTTKILYDLKKSTSGGKAYVITTDAEEAKKDSSLILKVYNKDIDAYEYKLSTEQKKEATDYVRNQMRAQYDYEETGVVTGQMERRDEPEWKNKKTLEDKKNVDAANMLGKFWYGDNDAANAASTYFGGFTNDEGEPLFTSINRTTTGVDVILASGEKKTIPFGKSQEDFIRSAGTLLAKQYDINTALTKGSYKKGQPLNKTATGGSTFVSPRETYESYIEDKLDLSLIGKSEEEAEAKIQEIAALGGFTATQSGAGNYITITRKAVKTSKGEIPAVSQEFSFGESDPEAQADVKNAIKKFLKANAVSGTLNKSGITQYKNSTTKPQTQGVGSKY
jgi:hypothetical protein